MTNADRAYVFINRIKAEDWSSMNSIVLSHDDDVRRDVVARLDSYLLATGISVNVSEMHDAMLGESIIGLMP